MRLQPANWFICTLPGSSARPSRQASQAHLISARPALRLRDLHRGNDEPPFGSLCISRHDPCREPAWRSRLAWVRPVNGRPRCANDLQRRESRLYG